MRALSSRDTQHRASRSCGLPSGCQTSAIQRPVPVVLRKIWRYVRNWARTLLGPTLRLPWTD
jgi:hypothetical protein